MHNENSTSMVCDSAFKDEFGSVLASSAELVRLNLLHSGMPVGEWPHEFGPKHAKIRSQEAYSNVESIFILHFCHLCDFAAFVLNAE